MRNLLIITALLLLTSCYRDSIETTKKGDFEVELLFEKDGCKMYRFSDGSHYIYWSNCSGRTEYNVVSGKTHKYIQELTTDSL